MLGNTPLVGELTTLSCQSLISQQTKKVKKSSTRAGGLSSQWRAIRNTQKTNSNEPVTFRAPSGQGSSTVPTDPQAEIDVNDYGGIDDASEVAAEAERAATSTKISTISSVSLPQMHIVEKRLTVCNTRQHRLLS